MARASMGDCVGATTDYESALSLASDPELVSSIKASMCAQDLGCDP